MFASFLYSFLSTFYYKQISFSDNYFNLLQNSKVFKHTANTPIATLLCNLEFLKTKLEDKNSREIIESCYLASIRLKNLINPQLDLRAGNNEKEKIYIRKTINDLKTFLMQNHKNSQINLNFELSENFYLRGSQFLFEEVIVCLINNSLEAYCKNQVKTIDIKVKLETHQSESNSQKKLIIYMTDYACGMNYLERKLATLPQYTHKKNNSGIGLHFVKTTIENYFAGELHIFSQKGFGTQVCLILPCRRK